MIGKRTYGSNASGDTGAWNAGFFGSTLQPLTVARDSALIATVSNGTFFTRQLDGTGRVSRAVPDAAPGSGTIPALSPDGRMVAILQAGEVVALMPVAGGPAVRTFSAPEFGGSGTLYLDNERLILRDVVRTWVWDVATGALVASIHQNSLTGVNNDAVRPGPDGTLVRFTAAGGVSLWDAASDTTVASMGDARTSVRMSAPLPDGRSFLSVDAQGARRWTPGTPARAVETLFTLNNQYGNRVLDAEVILEGRGVAYSHAGLHVWDPTRGARRVQTTASQGSNFLTLTANAAGSWLAAQSDPGRVSLVDVSQAAELQSFDLHALDARIPGFSSVSALAVSADGRTVVFSASGMGTGQSAALGMLRVGAPQPLAWLVQTSAPVTDIALSRDEASIATCTLAGLAVRSTATGEELWSPGRFATLCSQVEAGPGDGYWVASLNTVSLVHRESSEAARRWGAAGGVARMKASPDGRRLSWTLGDGTFELLHDGADSQPVRVIPAEHDGFVMSTRGGQYWASQHGLRAVRFQQGGEVIGADQLDADHNAPDQVLAQLGLGSPAVRRGFERARQARAERLAARGAPRPDFVHGPRLLEFSGIPVVSASTEITVRVRAEAGDAPLASVHTWVDGVPVPQVTGIPVEGASADVTIPVTLRTGTNTVEVSVVDTSGRESRRLLRQVSVRAGNSRGRLFVLAVGVGDYGSPATNLEFSVKDARDVARALVQVGGAYRSVETRVLADAQATREGILRDGRAFVAQSQPEDDVVVFFAGHGLRSRSGEFVFAASGVTPTNLETHGLRMSEVEGLLDGVGARRRLVLLDACFSGVDNGPPEVRRRQVGSEGTVRAGRPRGFVVTDETTAAPTERGTVREQTLLTGEAGLAELGRGTGAVVIASAAGREFALESDEWANGVFTYALIHGLRSGSADLDSDGVVTVSELQRHVSDRVQSLTEGAQSPMASRQNLTVDFAIMGGRVAPASQASTSPAGTPQAPASDVTRFDLVYGTSATTLSPSGCELASVTQEGGVELRSIDTGAAPRQLPARGGGYQALRYTTSGALVHGTQQVGYVLITNGVPTAIPAGSTQFWPRIAERSSDGLLALGVDGATVFVDPRSPSTPRRRSDIFQSPSFFLPSGALVIETGQIRDVLVDNPYAMLNGPPPGDDPASRFSFDGRLRVSIVDETVQVLDATSGAVQRTLSAPGLRDAALDPSGEFLVIGLASGHVRVIRVDDGQLVAQRQVAETSVGVMHGLRAVQASRGATRILVLQHMGPTFVWTRTREGLRCQP